MTYIQQLSALAHPHRLRIFRHLVKTGNHATPAGEIGAQLDISPSSLSGYLTTLVQAELLQSCRDGRFIHYKVNAETMRSLLDYLISDCCASQPDLCGFQSHDASTREATNASS